jgi:hypothetical protein
MFLAAAAVAAATTIAVPAATAATPATGQVSAADTTVSWTGEAYGQPFKFGPDFQTHANCIAPFCDTFTLTVADAGVVRVNLGAPGSAGYVDILVTHPDGTTEFLEGTETETAREILLEDASGDYAFDIWPNEIYGVYDGNVRGSAELCPATQERDTCFVEEEPAEEEEL